MCQIVKKIFRKNRNTVQVVPKVDAYICYENARFSGPDVAFASGRAFLVTFFASFFMSDVITFAKRLSECLIVVRQCSICDRPFV